MDTCFHLDTIAEVTPSSIGCEDCLAVERDDWVHLRMCQACGHVGCCDQSPGKHASGHYRAVGHPLVRSYEPDEDWFWCYPEDLMFMLKGAAAAPSHPVKRRRRFTM